MASSSMSLLGVNLSGGEYGDRSGKYGWSYIYPLTQEIDYHSSKGLDVIRLPFLWERLQPALNGPLDTTELLRLDAVVHYAAGKGMTVILDPHDYGAYDGQLVGGSAVPDSAFADFWGKLAGHYATDTHVVFALMNEPNRQSATSWLASENAAIAAIRATGATQEILVQGSYWDGASTWTTTDNAAVIGTGIADPANNYAFEVHQYLDTWSSGTEPTAVSASIGVERLTAITSWAEQHHARLFLGEFGAGQDATSLAALGNMLSFMNQHADVWQGGTYWAGGPWWGDYMYSIEPNADGTDKPQMDVLEQFVEPAATAGSSGSSGSTAGGDAVSTGTSDPDPADPSSPSTSDPGANDGDPGSDGLAGNGSSAVVDWTFRNRAVTTASILGGANGYRLVAGGDVGSGDTADLFSENLGGTVQNGDFQSGNVIANDHSFRVVGTGDFDGDGAPDLLFQNVDGSVAYWALVDGAFAGTGDVVAQVTGYSVVGTGDFDGDGTADILIEDGSGSVVDWLMGGGIVQAANTLGNADGYSVVGEGDFDGDGATDLLLQGGSSSGDLVGWMIQDGQRVGTDALGNGAGFSVVGTGDIDGNGTADVQLENLDGTFANWTFQDAAASGWHMMGA